MTASQNKTFRFGGSELRLAESLFKVNWGKRLAFFNMYSDFAPFKISARRVQLSCIKNAVR